MGIDHKVENEILKKEIVGKYPALASKFEEFRGQLSVRIEKENLLELVAFLKNNQELDFNYLTDLTGVDFLKMEREPRFDVVYHLYSFEKNWRIRIKVAVNEEDLDVPSLTSFWRAANWLEREAFEMFGFNFVGHPDLRRLLLPDLFDGYPLRKDYPLHGKGERDVILDLK